MSDFTPEAEDIIQAAKTVAKNRGKKFVDDTDILCSLIMRDYGLLTSRGIENEKQHEIRRKIMEGAGSPLIDDSDAPWTQKAIETLDNARRIAKEAGQNQTFAEDLLVGLIMSNGQAAKILRENGLNNGSFEKRGKKINVHIRWMIRRDMPEVWNIENKSFEFPWTEGDFIRCLRQRNCIGMVGEFEEMVVGYMIYELHKTRLHILNFAVHPDFLRLGAGTAMANKLFAKLSPQRRNRILLEVRETNLTAQLFFRDMGFRATSVLKDFFEDVPEDAYLMQYSYSPSEESFVFSAENRISRLAG